MYELIAIYSYSCCRIENSRNLRKWQDNMLGKSDKIRIKRLKNKLSSSFRFRFSFCRSKYNSGLTTTAEIFFIIRLLLSRYSLIKSNQSTSKLNRFNISENSNELDEVRAIKALVVIMSYSIQTDIFTWTRFMQDFRYFFLFQIFLDAKNPKRTSLLPDF